MVDLGGKLRAARLAAGLSLSEMASRTHFSKPFLGLVETGKRVATAEHISAYENALGVRLGREQVRVGSPDVELLSQATDLVTAMGLRHGGMAVAEMARAQWTWTQGLLGQDMSDTTRGDLSRQAGRLADRVGWSLSESGRGAQATKAYTTALDLSEEDHELTCVVTVNLARHLVDSGTPQDALELLKSLSPKQSVHEFTSYGVAAHAYASLGDWDGTVRAVGLADEAWSRVDLDNLPEVNKPYASGHEAHAHREAGRAFHALALRGVSKAIPVARQRLQLAIAGFGPDRANAVQQCRKRLESLT